MPQKAQSVEEALADYEETLLPGATSYGRTILADGRYIGDVWCYCIDPEDEPNCMVSFCLFQPEYRSKGITTAALRLFRGQYVMEPDGYKEVPKSIAEKIMTQRSKKDD